MTHLKSRMLLITFLLLSAASAMLVLLPTTDTEASAEAMAGIEKLHQQDIAATLSRDSRALTDLWTDDGVLLEPGGQAKIGKQLIGAEVEKSIAKQPGIKILSYVPEIKEVKILIGGIEKETLAGHCVLLLPLQMDLSMTNVMPREETSTPSNAASLR